MNKLILILTIFLIISCKSQTDFQKLYSEEMYAESFFSSLNLRTVSSNSFENDILIRYTLTSHLPKDNEELNKIRIKNGMTVENLNLNLKNFQADNNSQDIHLFLILKILIQQYFFYLYHYLFY